MINQLLSLLTRENKIPAEASPRSKPCRAGIEMLESRIAPAIFVVTTFADEVTPGDGKLSLREAINLANGNGIASDTIVLHAGTYKIGLFGSGDDANATGDFDITGDLRIVGAGANHTKIDGNGADRVFDILAPASGAHVSFKNLTITGGLAAGKGGGIRANNGNVANIGLNGVTMTGNHASSNGGAIYSDLGDISLFASHVDSNTSGSEGGGIYLNGGTGIVTLNESTLNANNAGSDGGGIADFSSGDFKVIKSRVLNNASESDGGGGEVDAKFVTITNSIISGNRSGSDGGGLDVDFGSTGLITVTNSIFHDNRSES